MSCADFFTESVRATPTARAGLLGEPREPRLSREHAACRSRAEAVEAGPRLPTDREPRPRGAGAGGLAGPRALTGEGRGAWERPERPAAVGKHALRSPHPRTPPRYSTPHRPAASRCVRPALRRDRPHVSQGRFRWTPGKFCKCFAAREAGDAIETHRSNSFRLTILI